MSASPLGFGGVRSPSQPAPQLGQHTELTSLGVLGLNPGEIGRLHDAGIVASAVSAHTLS